MKDVEPACILTLCPLLFSGMFAAELATPALQDARELATGTDPRYIGNVASSPTQRPGKTDALTVFLLSVTNQNAAIHLFLASGGLIFSTASARTTSLPGR
jgi:hypothetical protein